jgi:flagellar basal-body rod protein FlgG
MKRMDVISNNVANSDTTGFKRDFAVSRPFSDELMIRLNDVVSLGNRRTGDINPGVFVDSVYTDFGGGSLRQTGGALDAAISGGGFFAVEVRAADGTVTEKYTRDGSFTTLADGTLATKDGSEVLGLRGAIRLGAYGEIVVDDSGRVYQGGRFIDQLRLVDFADYDSLRKYGDNFYDPTDVAPVDFNGRVVSGFLENSNVNSVKELVDMINVSRLYETNQKMMTMIDTTMDLAASRIASRT